jgi:type I restriction enzyme S subunit
MDKYQSYKQSGVEWIGEIPSNWGVTKIKYTKKDSKDSFIDGDWIESKDLSDEGVRYITSGNIGEGKYKEQGNGYISEDTFKKLNCTEIFEGDLVISRLFLPVGRSCIIPNLNNRVITCVDNVVLRPKESFDKFYLNYQFNSNRYSEFTELISRGVTLTRISRGMLGNNSIVVPPLSEQLQIVQFLDNKTELIDKLISTKERKISLLKEQRSSLINQVITKGLNPYVKMKDSGMEWIGEIPEVWTISKLKYNGVFFSGYSFDSGDFLSEGEIRVIKISNIQNNGISWDDLSFVPTEFYDKYYNFIVKKGDLIFVLTRPIVSTGIKICFYDEDFKVLLNQRNSVFRPNSNNLNKIFTYYLVRTRYFFEEFKQQLKETNQPNISTEQISNIKIFLPPINEQNQIVEYLNSKTKEIDYLVRLEQKKIDLLKEYRQSLISEVVTGKIKI